MTKLQKALKTKGVIVTINSTQFYSKEKDRMITLYTIKKVAKGKGVELLQSCSQIECIKCLADLLGVKIDENN